MCYIHLQANFQGHVLSSSHQVYLVRHTNRPPVPDQLDQRTAVQACTEFWAVNATIVETQLPDVLVFSTAFANIEVK